MPTPEPSPIRFDPADPFPLVADWVARRAEVLAHSREVDAWLGIEVAGIERGLRAPPDGRERWIGLDPESLQTPYLELRALLADVGSPPGAHWVDLGCGYARLAFVLGRCFPAARFTGYECVPERAAAAREALASERGRAWAPREARVETADLADPALALPPGADRFLLYDFGETSVVSTTLDRLRERARGGPIAVIGRGRRSRDLIEREHPWLSQVVAPRHGPTASIYRSA